MTSVVFFFLVGEILFPEIVTPRVQIHCIYIYVITFSQTSAIKFNLLFFSFSVRQTAEAANPWDQITVSLICDQISHRWVVGISFLFFSHFLGTKSHSSGPDASRRNPDTLLHSIVWQTAGVANPWESVTDHRWLVGISFLFFFRLLGNQIALSAKESRRFSQESRHILIYNCYICTFVKSFVPVADSFRENTFLELSLKPLLFPPIRCQCRMVRMLYVGADRQHELLSVTQQMPSPPDMNQERTKVKPPKECTTPNDVSPTLWYICPRAGLLCVCIFTCERLRNDSPLWVLRFHCNFRRGRNEEKKKRKSVLRKLKQNAGVLQTGFWSFLFGQ